MISFFSILVWKQKYKKKRINFFLYVSNFLFITGALIFVVTQNAEATRIALTPLVFELTGERNGIIDGEVRVMNPSFDEKISVVMESEDIFPEGEEGRIKLEVPPPERIPFSLSSWISFEPQRFNLEPREEKAIKFSIKVPQNAEPGGHYAAIIAKSENPTGPTGVGVGIVQRVASLVLLTVTGQTKEELKVIGFQTSKNYYEKGPVDFAVRFENTGTVHLKPNAKITIYNILKRKVAEIPLEARNILPSSIRKIEAQWAPKWLFGAKYIAVLSGTYGKADNPLEETIISFWAFSWKVGIAIILIIIFFWITRKRWMQAFKILLKGERALKE